MGAQESTAFQMPDDRLVGVAKEMVDQLAQQKRHGIKAQQGKLIGRLVEIMVQLELQKRRQQQQQQDEKEERVLEEVKVVEEQKERVEEKEVSEEKEEQRNAPPPPLWSVAEPDWWLDRMPPSSPSPQQQAKMEGDQRTAAGKEMVVVVEKDSRSDVVDKETGGLEEKSMQQQEMVVVVEKEEGSDVEQRLPAEAPTSPWPPPTLQGLPAGLRALIARSDPSGTRWWFDVKYDGGHGKEDVKKITGIGTGCMVSIFGSWGKEPGRRRLTRTSRERVREKEKSSPTRED